MTCGDITIKCKYQKGEICTATKKVKVKDGDTDYYKCSLKINKPDIPDLIGLA